MKNIEELLKIMLETQLLFKRGLCSWAIQMLTYDVISFQEWISLRDYISNNKPLNFRTIVGTAYFWKEGDISPRIEWINKHIKLNSNGTKSNIS